MISWVLIDSVQTVESYFLPFRNSIIAILDSLTLNLNSTSVPSRAEEDRFERGWFASQGSEIRGIILRMNNKHCNLF